MYHFCTYFDKNFLIKGLTLYSSLRKHTPGSFKLWVLCLDNSTYDILRQLDLKDLHPISMQDFEAGDTELLKAKTNRTRVEYFFTCTPSLPLFVLRQNPSIGTITYLDADLFFFSSIDSIFHAFEDYSILIIPHRYPEALKRLEEYGIFNVGLLSFRNDSAGTECLEW